ncbi:MAG: PQQ-binding-like beta-propeller repeat protein, partial [Planctomycetales bacterium]|nr:PQQ-binding-like beta-propeller repeat protein [Planctomycetales bacterium]
RRPKPRATRLLVVGAILFVLPLVAGFTPSHVTAQLPPVGEAPLSADVQLDDIGGPERSHLDTVEAFLADQQWDEAVETLRRLMENEGDRMIAADGQVRHEPGDFVRYVSLRRFCQMRLARMHGEFPEALALYRRRVDPLAERWLTEARAGADASQLARIVREMFVSSFGDDALYSLGELALEQGDFALARDCWMRISPRFYTPELADPPIPIPSARPWWPALKGADLNDADRYGPFLAEDAAASAPPQRLIYPDTDLNLADVWARLVLVSIIEGSPDRASVELELLRRWWPEARGRIGGREGLYLDLLSAMLEQSRTWPPLPTDPWWPTFAGNDRRNRVAGDTAGTELRPLWRAPLARLTAESEIVGEGRPRVAESADALLPYHPVVSNGVVFVNEFTRVRAFDLVSGQPWPAESMRAGIFDTKVEPAEAVTMRGNFVGVPRSTLTLSGDRLYARMGSPITGRAQPEEVLLEQRSFLVGLDLAAEGRLLPGFPLRLADAEWRNWEFEGSPLADSAFIYVVMRHRDNVNAKLHVVCFEAKTGAIRWRSPLIVAADSLGHGTRDELTHTLLSRDHHRLYVNTNLGVIACLNIENGDLQWVTRYPRASFRTLDPDDSDRHFFRDLNPCVVHRDLVIAAPTDCNRIFALHALSGQLIWATESERAVDAVHLLGVGQEHLIVSGDYLYWFDVDTGRPVGQFPPPGVNVEGYARPDPRGYGRGVLAGDEVYFPTTDGIYVFAQRTKHGDRGWDPQQLHMLDLTQLSATGGNLMIAGDKLIIATPDEIVCLGK